jgi:hypothetical protein
MAVSSNNIKILFFGGICALFWGGYNVTMATLYSFNWNETEGTVVDFERHTMTCGKGVGECYSLLIGYHAGNDYFVTASNKKYSRNKPMHLAERKVAVYYSPDDTSEAILGGEYGPFNYGLYGILGGMVMMFVSWIAGKSY